MKTVVFLDTIERSGRDNDYGEQSGMFKERKKKATNAMRSGSTQITPTSVGFSTTNVEYVKTLQRGRVRVQPCVHRSVSVCHFELGPMTNICFLSDGRTVIAPACCVCRRGAVVIDRADSIQVARLYRHCISSRKLSR